MRKKTFAKKPFNTKKSLTSKEKLNRPSFVKKSLPGEGFESKKLNFLQKNFFPYSFPIVIVSLVVIPFLLLTLYYIFFDKSNSVLSLTPDFWTTYFIVLILFYFWSLVHCLVMGVLTNFIVLDALLPFLKCSSNKLDIDAYLKMPLTICILCCVSLLASLGIFFFGFLGVGILPYAEVVSFLVIFALFLFNINRVKRIIKPVCKTDLESYLVSLVFVLTNYIQLLTLFTVMVLFLIVTFFVMTSF